RQGGRGAPPRGRRRGPFERYARHRHANAGVGWAKLAPQSGRACPRGSRHPIRILALDKRIRVDSNEVIRAWRLPGTCAANFSRSLAMTRAAAAVSAARRLLPYGFRFPRRATISGHAKLLARPAYQKLLTAEPLLRKLIPVLIFIFLVIVGLARFVELYQLKFEREYQARESLG